MKRPAECLQHCDGPNRNGSYGDRVMAIKPLPSQEVLRQLLEYDPETGDFLWKRRGVCFFFWSDNPRLHHRAWNTKYAGRTAFGYTGTGGYKRAKLFGRVCLAHRIAWKISYGTEPEIIDHADGDPGNNRLSNLREANPTQNSQNCKKQRVRTTSKHKGVCKVSGKGRAWRATIRHNGEAKYLGTFCSEVEAAQAYDAAAKEYHGEFAKVNFADAESLPTTPGD